jgi:curli biogenesis system outer membrane secretion channel CsgG
MRYTRSLLRPVVPVLGRIVLFSAALSLCAYSQTTNLWTAVEEGSLADVEAQLAKGESINQLNAQGESPLIRAVIQARYDLLPELLRLGADPKVIEKGGYTALTHAALDGELPAVQALVRAGADISPASAKGREAFRAALRGGHPEVIAFFLSSGFSPTAEVAFTDWSALPIHLAAAGSSLGIQQLGKVPLDLLTRTTEPTRAITPLATAAFNDKPGVIRQLVRDGANPLLTTADGRSILAVAAFHADSRTATGLRAFQMLLKAPQPKTTPITRRFIHRAKTWGLTDDLIALNQKAPDAPFTDPSPLLRDAVLAHAPRRLSEALESFDPNLWDSNRSLLFFAAARADRPTLDALHSFAGQGTALAELDAKGRSQVHHAVTNPDPSALAFYLYNQHWIKPSLADLSGLTPLMLAAQIGNLNAIDALHAAEVPLNQADHRGRTALDHAQSAGQSAAANRLASFGAQSGFLPPALSSEPSRPPPSLASAPLPSLTAAVLDFDTSADVWFESSRTGADLATLLQTRLSQLPQIDWVERSELSKVRAEMELTSAGSTTGADALALGRLLKADLLLRGQVGEELGFGRHVTLQVLDAKRGEVLAQRSCRWKTPTAEPWSLLPDHLTEATRLATEAITEARQRLVTSPETRIIAPLFISQLSSASPALDHFGKSLPRLLQTAAANSPVRVLQFDTEGQVQDEAALAVSGLASSMDAVRGVAHYFVWGTCQVTPGAVGNDLPVELALHFWDGQGDPETRRQTCPTSQLHSTATELMQTWLQTALAAPLPPPPSNAALQTIAQNLYEQALPLLTKARSQPHARLHATQLLETARFFDPQHALADACRLLVRWDNTQLRRPNYSATAFYQSWHQLNAWRDHLAQHGHSAMDAINSRHPAYSLLQVKPHSKGLPLASANYFALLQDMVEKLHHRALGYLDTVPPVERREMLHRLCQETLTHIKRHTREFPNARPVSTALDLCEAAETVLSLPDCIELGTLLWKSTLTHKREFLGPAAVRRLRHCLLKWHDEADQAALAYRSFHLRDYASPDPRFQSIDRPSRPTIAKTSPIQPPLPTPADSAATLGPVTVPIPINLNPKRLPTPKAWNAPSSNFRVASAGSNGTNAALSLSYSTQSGNEHLVALWQPDQHQFKPLSPHPIAGQVFNSLTVSAAGQIWVGGYNNPLYRGDLKDFTLHPQGPAEKLPFLGHIQGLQAGDHFFLRGEGSVTRDQSRLASWHPQGGWRIEPSAHSALPDAPPAFELFHLCASEQHLYGLARINKRRQYLLSLNLNTRTWQHLPWPAFIDPTVRSQLIAATDEEIWLLQNQRLLRIPLQAGETVQIDLSPDAPDPDGLQIKFAELDQDWLWALVKEQIPKPVNSSYPFPKQPQLSLLAVYLPTSKAARIVFDDLAEHAGLVVTPSAVCPLIAPLGDHFAKDRPSPFVRFDKATLLNAFGNTLR